MPSNESVTQWIHQLKGGERAAVQKVWEAYFPRLVCQAQRWLRRSPIRVVDAEDIALSAFDSFCRRAENGQFPNLLDRDNLWQLLVAITLRKAENLVHHERAQKRGGGKVVPVSALGGGDSAAGRAEFTNLIARDPDPRFAVQMAEECRQLLDGLGDAGLQSIAVWKMEGLSNQEIAGQLGRSERTVERKLGLIRKIWEGMA